MALLVAMTPFLFQFRYHCCYFLFQKIHSSLDGYPYDAFHLDLPHSNLLDNAHVSINKYGRLKKKNLNFYIDVSNYSRSKKGNVEKKTSAGKEGKYHLHNRKHNGMALFLKLVNIQIFLSQNKRT